MDGATRGVSTALESRTGVPESMAPVGRRSADQSAQVFDGLIQGGGTT